VTPFKGFTILFCLRAVAVALDRAHLIHVAVYQGFVASRPRCNARREPDKLVEVGREGRSMIGLSNIASVKQ